MSKGGRGRGARRAWFLPLNLVLDPSPEGTHLDPFGPLELGSWDSAAYDWMHSQGANDSGNFEAGQPLEYFSAA